MNCDVVGDEGRAAGHGFLSARERFGNMVGRSPAMRAVFAVIERAAASDTTVLITGETGTGKEEAARAIHGESRRRKHPFVVVDCGALPSELLESELFGHEKGAFTGATAGRVGAFEEASGGTLFLDEIGELSIDLQPKLLRAIERREIKRVGSNRYRPFDVRLVAATNRELREEVSVGRFRSDFYYRLAVLHIRLPPLRERPEDLELLRDAVVADLEPSSAARLEPLLHSMSGDELKKHAWPGNVRELRNYVERCLVLREAVRLPPETEEAVEPDAAGEAPLPLRAAREQWTRQYLEQVLCLADNNIAAAAGIAGVARFHLYRLLRQYGLR